jgi:hypothetical protein
MVYWTIRGSKGYILRGTKMSPFFPNAARVISF